MNQEMFKCDGQFGVNTGDRRLNAWGEHGGAHFSGIQEAYSLGNVCEIYRLYENAISWLPMHALQREGIHSQP